MNRRMAVVFGSIAAAGCYGDRTVSMVSGEVRGMPPATTAYARVVQLEDTVASRIVSDACKVFAESLRTLPAKVRAVAASMSRELGKKSIEDCERVMGGDAGWACTSKQALADVKMKLSAEPHLAPPHWRDEMLALKAKREGREKAVREEATARFRMLRDSLVSVPLRAAQGASLHPDGTFQLSGDDTSSYYVVVLSPAGPELARVPRVGSSVVPLAYDSATFLSGPSCTGGR